MQGKIYNSKYIYFLIKIFYFYFFYILRYTESSEEVFLYITEYLLMTKEEF